VRYHRGQIKLNRDEQNQLAISPQRIHLLIQILRLSIILTQGRLQTIDTPIKVSHDNNALIVALATQPELLTKLNSEVERQANIGLTLTIKTEP